MLLTQFTGLFHHLIMFFLGYLKNSFSTLSVSLLLNLFFVCSMFALGCEGVPRGLRGGCEGVPRDGSLPTPNQPPGYSLQIPFIYKTK